MLKNLLHCMLISTAVLAADNSDPFSAPTASSSKSERVILSEDSGEPSAKKQRLETPYETMYMFLPDELIVNIATFASIKSGIQMSSTCKNWKQALDHSSIWQHYASRLAGYEFFKDEPCFKREEGSIDYRKMIKAASYPFIFIFNKNFILTVFPRDASSILGYIQSEEIAPLFSPFINGEEVRSSIVPYTFHSLSPFYSPSKTSLIIKNYQEEFKNAFTGFCYNTHQGTLEFLEAPEELEASEALEDSEDSKGGVATVMPIFISKDRTIIIGTDQESYEPIHIWCGEEGKRTYQEKEGTPTKVANDGKIILGQYNNQACVFSQNFYPPLETLNGGLKSTAVDINCDQTIIIGNSEVGSTPPQWRAVKWVNGKIQLLDLLEEGQHSKASAVSEDGKVIIGSATTSLKGKEERAVKWTDEGVQTLDPLEGWYSSEASAISADGKVIIGNGTLTTEEGATLSYHALRWTSRGVEYLTTLLKTILPPQLTLERVNSMNADGSIMEGYLEWSRERLLYFAFVPREDILEKEGLRAHF